MGIRLPFRSLLLISLLLCAEQGSSANAQQRRGFVPVADAPLKTAEIVNALVKRNEERAEALHSYAGTRIYQVKYRGFPSGRDAEMVIDVKYQSPATKEFTIRSAAGSSIILDKVFNKLLEAEKEQSSPEAQARAALNNDNYKFTQVGYQETPFRLMYVLAVEPRRKDKFLYQGRIWIDAQDFAVVRLEARPAKNPSLWTRSSLIEQMYTKVGRFWLPLRNHSVSAIRLGGTAELTIEYKDYRIGRPEEVDNLSTVESDQSPGTVRERR
ncbi:MAG TPA: hypothetical protein VN682_04945 [Terriglobales bacterium]|nr:hypothetical protein [Terriglobales bacterium]